MKNKFQGNFKFYSNVDITKCSGNNFPRFDKQILTLCSSYLQQLINSQFLWSNKDIKVDGLSSVTQSAILGLIDTNIKHFLLISHLLLIYKCYLYKARDS